MKNVLNPSLVVVCSFVLLTNFCHGWISQRQYINSQYQIVLSDVTPQGILHQTPLKKLENYDPSKCHYLITANFPDSSNKTFGISIGLLQLQANKRNAVKISTSPGNPPIVWNTNKPYSIVPSYEFKQNTNESCIQFEGDWTNSTADFVLTVYSNFDDEKCPEGLKQCKCTKKYNDDDSSSEEDSRELKNEDRCIYSDMLCNGVSNCGKDCSYDETAEVCKKLGPEVMEYCECGWGGFEYMFMMAMTGFLLILIPVIFLVILIYHRKFTAAGSLMAMSRGMRRSFDGNNNVEQDPNVPHVISGTPVYFDQPPSYDDLPEEVKVPRHQYLQNGPTTQNEINV